MLVGIRGSSFSHHSARTEMAPKQWYRRRKAGQKKTLEGPESSSMRRINLRFLQNIAFQPRNAIFLRRRAYQNSFGEPKEVVIQNCLGGEGLPKFP